MIELLNIDCMDYMAGLPDKAFDLAIVDPPYGLGKTWGKSSDKDYAYRNKYENKKWNNTTPSQYYFEQLYRVSKNQIIWGCNYFMEARIIHAGRLVWDKMSAQDITSSCDLASQSFSNKIDLVRFLWDGYRQGEFEERIHPTQKPIYLYKWCFNKYLNLSNSTPLKIIDTHLGSGSSAIAAHGMGFDFVGCELDKDYYDAACKRFKEQTMQQKLFI